MKPIIEEVRAQETVFQLYKRIRKPHSFFLDSSMRSGSQGRYSFFGAEPFLLFTSRKNTINVDLDGWKKSFSGNPFLVLDELFKRYESPFRTGKFPFWGGAVGYFSYDMKDHVEKLPDTARRDTISPDCVVGFYDCVGIFDNLSGKIFLSSTGYPETGGKRPYRARARIENLKNMIFRNTEEDDFFNDSEPSSPLESNFSRESYINSVLKAKEYIKNGDIYQVNLSQRFSAPLEAGPFSIYEKIRSINPAPFGAYLDLGEVKIISSSPERFLKIENKSVETRPIKGTRPRGRGVREDSANKSELMSSRKDAAENLMIVDLERNDLGKICEYGSVHVSAFQELEEFPTVFHLTSTIRGKLKDNLSPVQALMSSFPGGSITGAPKIRSMEIIEELEGVKRSVYTGAIGYICFNGDMDTSIAIRTIINEGKKLYFSAGGGIVYDSDPEMEYEETLHKARAMIEAVYSSS